jgi:hypothetical protein
MPRKRRAPKSRRDTPREVPPAIQHYLTTGDYTSDLPGKWDLFEALYAPLGSSREEAKVWDPQAALEPYRALLRADGVRLRL